MEVHGGHLSEVRIRHINVQALRLANISATGNGKVDEALLWDLPDRFVELLDVRWDGLDLLDRAVESQKCILDIRGPETELNQVVN